MAKDLVNHQRSSWIELGRELLKRTTEPLAHVSFVIYFFVAVIVFGGIGFWVELYAFLIYNVSPTVQIAQVTSLRTAVITFFPALTGPACLQLILAESHQKSLRAFGAFFLFAITLIALGISPEAVGNRSALVVGFFSSMAALWTWWIANAKQKDLLDVNPDAPLGGDKDAALAGNLDGFTF